ncbi:MAG TPA: hypothetical protein VGU27_07635 [Candidatus Eisenbacteria bacterium]|nr:hypothetical protein [Candidatus Eisenbacteria bacterium]
MIAAAVADSVATAAGHPAGRAFTLVGIHGPHAAAQAEAFARAVQGWHEFYLLAGTAAATLVGLLFVSLSFHLDALLHESKAHLLRASQATFTYFVFVLVMSLMFLIPAQGPVFMGLWVAFDSVVFLGVTLHSMWKTRGVHDAHGHDRFMRRRQRAALIAFVFALGNSVALILEHDPLLLYNYVAPVCLLLGSAAGTAWDLLVEVGRLRRAEAEPGP